MGYSKKRNRGKGITEENLEESLSIIADFFTEDWVNDNNNHPLQLLWERKDALSTNELYTFGYSLLSIKDMDTNWINENIRLIKEGNLNNVIGYVFEIIAASMIKNGENQELELPPSGNPGIDLIALFNDGSKMNISCKNYGLSDRNKIFNQNAGNIESVFLELCKKYNKNKIQCHILSNRYVEDRDWTILKSNMEYMVKNFDGTMLQGVGNETWLITLLPLDDGPNKYSDDYLTYTFSLVSPFYEHERNNLYIKLDDACYNLEKHGVLQDDNEINIIFIHLPETASLKECKKWADEYLEVNTDKPIAGIFFIQNLNATNIENKEAYISVTMQVAVNEIYTTWINKNDSERLISFSIPVGQISNEIPEFIFIKDGEEVDMGDFNTDESYKYQRGKHYVEYIGEHIEAKMEIIGSGVHEYAIILSKEGKVLFTPNFPPDDRLILI